ncbi:hypothetical protein PIB30_036616 [Stylosanthes scabra]|uniref:Uncharacterized protein n=1 Tax=Stylosanthes scabra TaxID=79078 RepID=A0ABU6RDN2_9FABA|nr:hypothetical protein [Stylosanthes scabra]
MEIDEGEKASKKTHVTTELAEAENGRGDEQIEMERGLRMCNCLRLHQRRQE